MQPIVCATRGGEASRRTQDRAVALAKERRAQLVFLYVADCGIAGPVDPSLAATVTDELMRLGRSLVSIAQVRAQEQRVDAQVVVLCGEVRKSIQDFLRQVGAGTLVIGKSRPASGQEAPDRVSAEEFADAIHQATGVEVIVITPDDEGRG